MSKVKKPGLPNRPNAETQASAITVANSSFTSNNGYQNQGTMTNGQLVPAGGPLQVNGAVMPNGFIPGIQYIQIGLGSGSYQDQIQVYGQCPDGQWDNLLTFTDASGDTYELRIYSTTPKLHTVNYSSFNPIITTVTWDI